MKELFSIYPGECFHSIYIGNEGLFRNNLTPHQLVEYIRETKELLTTLCLENVPVGTSEIGSRIAPELYKKCYFIGISIRFSVVLKLIMEHDGYSIITMAS